MTRPSKTKIIDGAYDLDYGTMQRVVAGCGGWIREGDVAKVWFDDVEYVFKGRGLVAFLYAVKDNANSHVYAAADLCDYILKAENQPPSVFVRDAIVARARKLRAEIMGDAA